MLAPDQALLADPEEALDLIDGLVLAGGADIDPASYGAQPHPETLDTVPERDRFEIALVRAAIERDLPVLGICRGMQLINVAYGGTLLQHLPERFGHHEHRRVLGTFDGADHDVELVEGSLAAHAAGEPATRPSPTTTRVSIVSARAFVSGCSAMDGLPEAIEIPGRRFVLGVQWHPEADEASSVVEALVPRLPRAPRARWRGVQAARRGGRSRDGRRPDGSYSSRRAAVEGHQSNRLGSGGRGRDGAAAAQACQGAPAASMQTRRLRRPGGPVRGRAALARRDVAVCALQMWAYLAAYKSPHDDEQGQRARVHVDYPIAVDRMLGLGELPTVRLQRALAAAAPTRPVARARRRRSCGRTGGGSWCRTARSCTSWCAAAPIRARGGIDLRGVRHRRDRLLGAADRAALVRGRGRRRTRRAATGCAAHDGRVRRVFLERRLGPALQCAWRQSLRRDALAALRHIGDGRAPSRGPVRSRARSAARTRQRSVSRWCIWGSTMSWICSGARPSRRQCGGWGRARDRRSNAWGARSRNWRRWPTRRFEGRGEREQDGAGRGT